MTGAKQRPIRIGVQIAQQHGDYADIRRAAAEAEDIGVDIIFNWDHFFPLSGEKYGKHFECWTMLGAWAEQTSRVQLGALVTCNSYRNPELLADMARTVDHISDGRLILGIGSGWKELDYTEYGYEFGTPGSRLDDLAEAMPRIEARLAKLNPVPTRKIPVLIGGGGEKKTLRLVAKHADIWHSFAKGADFARKKQVLARTAPTSAATLARSSCPSAPAATPRRDGAALLEQGVTTFTVGVGGPDFDLSAVRAWVDWRDKLGK